MEQHEHHGTDDQDAPGHWFTSNRHPAACIDACRQCIRTDLDCADVCAATGAVLTRLTEPNTLIQRAVLEACAVVCGECAQECEQHKDMHEHCKVCAEACRRCEQACQDLLNALG